MLDHYTTNEILEYLFENHPLDSILEEIDHSKLLAYVVDNTDIKTILDELDEDDIVDYVAKYRFVAYDIDDAIQTLRCNGHIDDISKTFCFGADLYKKEAIELIRDIVQRYGWNYLHQMLEARKEKLNIP